MLLHYCKLVGQETDKSSIIVIIGLSSTEHVLMWPELNHKWTWVLPANPHNGPQSCCQRAEATRCNLVFIKERSRDRAWGLCRAPPLTLFETLNKLLNPSVPNFLICKVGIKVPCCIKYGKMQWETYLHSYFSELLYQSLEFGCS